MNARFILAILIIFGVVRSLSGQIFSEVDVGLIGVDVSQNRDAWGDFDNDGDLDLLLTGSSNDLIENVNLTRIYRNDGGNFQPIAMAPPDLSLSAASWGDYDNDGDLDILLSGSSDSGRMTAVYRNDDGFFTDINVAFTGLSRSSLDWGDFDNDGDLDIIIIGLVTATEALSLIYRNNNGAFANLPFVLPDLFLGVASWIDYDNDADLDIFLSAQQASNTQPTTTIYANENGVFARVESPFLAVSGGPAAWGDFDNDADLDVIVTGASDLGLLSRLYENLGNTFRNGGANLANVWGGAVAWGDIDNDGDLDIVLTGSKADNTFLSQILRNDGGIFALKPDESLMPVTSTASSAFGDYDNDGDLDLLLTGSASPDGTIANGIGSVARLYQNNIARRNSRPDPPQQLNASIVGLDVVLQWDRGSDAETPQLGLSYNLRVGAEPGGVDVMSPMADVVSGHRRVAAIGNAFQNTRWILRDLAPGTYYWSVQSIDHAFAGSLFAEEQSISISESDALLEFSLQQNYPNPFNPATTIEFYLPIQEFVSLRLYSLAGKEIQTLLSGMRHAGRHEVQFDAGHLTSGIYLYRLKAGHFSSCRKMAVVR